MNRRRLVMGSRGSALAMAQANLVRSLLHASFPALDIEIKIVKTSGDKMTSASLARSGVKGIFTRELEQALLRGKIDLAVHSLKDMPTELPAGLALPAMLEREDPSDVVLAREEADFMKPVAIYTSSPRRAFQAKRLWPGVPVREIRGNVETRLGKLVDLGRGNVLLLAAAGLRRLDYLRGGAEVGRLSFELTVYYRRLKWDQMIPAPGQGVIAIEIRGEDDRTATLLRGLNHFPTQSAAESERAFLQGVGGGCAAPIAAHAEVRWSELKLIAMVAREEGEVWKGERSGACGQAKDLGKSLAEQYLRDCS